MAASDLLGRLPLRYWGAVKRRAGRPLRYWQRQQVRLDGSDICAALKSFGVAKPALLLVHSSLSACGHIQGGPSTVLGALADWTAGGTLVMPTHTYCYPDETGDAPVFSQAATPSQVGAITNDFRQRQGVIRSLHPTHSVACLGPQSAEICRGHECCETPCGPGTPYERLIDADASVLMFGVPMSCYTLFYMSEHMAAVPHLYDPEPVRLKLALPGGEIREMLMWRQSSIARRFVEAGDQMESAGLVKSRPLGRGTLRLIPSARRVHEWLLEKLDENPEFLVAPSARSHDPGRHRQAHV